ncbi:MAG: exodeoxyribonuclease V subunit alpha [Chlamydiae bacterium]|nr:exodeoxyribonuclease V subunit alpha [Chlamydiota bacterium]
MLNDPWPIFDFCLQNLIFDDSDLFFVKNYLGLKNEPEALFAAYLFNISKKGELFLSYEDNQIFPSLASLFPDLSLKEQIEPLIIEGLKNISSHVIQKVKEIDFYPTKPICEFNNFYFLQRNWVFKNAIDKNLKKMMAILPSDLDEDLFYKSLTQEFLEKKLLEGQKEAIEKILKTNFLVIAGGPGTGKSYTAAFLIKTLLSSLDKKTNFKILISALTGKAVSKISESISKHIDAPFKAVTLHSLLNIKENSKKNFSEDKIEADLLIVDEASMIDIRLMAYLLDGLLPHTKIVLMGDPDQLSPIGGKNIFRDIVSCLPVKNIAKLTKNMRFENIEISNFAKLIQEKKTEDVFSFFQSDKIKFLDLNDEKDEKHKIIERALPYYHYISEKPDPITSLKNLEKFAILSCLRVGRLGVEEINEAIFQALLEKKRGWMVLPIIITRNDYRLELFNGMIGVQIIDLKYRKQSENSPIYFNIENTLKEMSLFTLSHFEYGFCLSVHKGQGSEFEKVMLIIPPSSKIFGNELLYTAVTRAKKELEIVSKKEIFLELIKTENKKSPNFLRLGDFREN